MNRLIFSLDVEFLYIFVLLRVVAFIRFTLFLKLNTFIIIKIYNYLFEAHKIMVLVRKEKLKTVLIEL